MKAKSLLRAVALVGWMSLWAAPALAEPVAGQPEGTLLEAEANAGSDSQVADDAKASGGKAVSNGKAWQPVFVAAVPADLADRVYVQVRHRGGPIQLKTFAGEAQTERDWIWAKPTDWSWSKLGPYAKADLGSRVLLMRGDGEGSVAIDCVVFSAVAPAAAPKGAAGGGGGPVLPPGVSEARRTDALPPERPDASKPAVAVDVTIDWGKKVGVAPAALWGVNDYEALDPKAAGDVGYHTAMQALRPPVVRLHHGGFPAEWMDASGTGWDVAKIRAAMGAASPALGSSQLMVNIATWPAAWQDADGVLKREHEADYAKLLVELMRIYRDELHRPVAYWEVLNERDGEFYGKGRFGDVCRVYVTAVRAMKAFDPGAKVGGFAFTWANPQWVDAFVKSGAAGVSDFLTYHNYGIGEVTDSNEKLFSTLAAIEGHAKFIRKVASETLRDGKGGPVMLSEYNVKWVWEPLEPRHANAVGAAFQAAVLRRVALAGIDGAMVWHLKGNAYGLFDADDRARLTSHLYRWGPQHLVGTIAGHSEPTQGVEVLPVVREGGKRSVLLINTADRGATLPPVGKLFGRSAGVGGVMQYRVESGGVSEGWIANAKSDLVLPGFSVTLLVEQ